jgi:hypothetical protein
MATKVDVVARTAPIPEQTLPVSRLTADGVHGACRLQAYLCFATAGPTWMVHRYAYRLTGGAVRRCNAVNLRLVSDGAVAYAFEPAGDIVNDGRWYVHEHETEVPKAALTYARFEAWFEVPGLARLAWGDLWDPRPAGAVARRARTLHPLRGAGDRDPRARIGPGPRHAQDIERATQGT